jgi:mannose-6-phosphate isomerase-like protein (cupin superfamily)
MTEENGMETLNMATTKTHVGIPWDGRTAYERWVEDDLALDLHRGYAAGNLSKVPVKPWAERGIGAAFYDIIGAESLAGLYVGEIAPGASSKPWRQLCDEVIFIISGSGSTSVETPKRTISFEWGKHSLFAVPLNHPYRLHNGSGTEPVRFVSVNTIPIVYNLFRDKRFVFGVDWNFDRIDVDADPADMELYQPDAKHERTAVNLYETSFVPDVLAVPRSSFAEKGEGNNTAYFELANSVISAHLAQHPGLQFYNPHRHGPSAFVFTLPGATGYTTMWQEGRPEVRFDWPEDDYGVVVPPNMWWHGHFGTSPSAYQLAVKLRSRKIPLNHLFDKTHKTVAEGGTLLRYKDLPEELRTRVWSTYVAECKKRGYEVKEPK